MAVGGHLRLHLLPVVDKTKKSWFRGLHLLFKKDLLLLQIHFTQLWVARGKPGIWVAGSESSEQGAGASVLSERRWISRELRIVPFSC